MLVQASLVIIVIVSLILAPRLHATTHHFYRDKRLTLIDGGSPGGGSDIVARSIARILHKYVGARGTIVQSMPGAGGVVMTNYMSRVVKPDELRLGHYYGSILALGQITLPGVVYDLREMSWIGVVGPLQNVLIADARKYRSIAELKAQKQPIIFGLASKGGMGHFNALTVQKVLGLDFKYITGYGGAGLPPAMERGEIDITAVNVLPFMSGVREGRFVPLMVLSRFRVPAIPDVPTIYEALGQIPGPLAVWIDLSLVGPGVFGPPGIPNDRLEFLRQALLNVSEDAEFRDLARKQGMLIQFVGGEEVKKITGEFLGMSEDLRADLRKLLER